MASKKLNINGHVFTVKPNDNVRVLDAWHRTAGCIRNEIYFAYNRPSSTKVEIWDKWCDWCDEINDGHSECELHIESRNTNFFTIGGYVCNNDTGGEYVPIKITYANNYCFM